MIFSIIVGFLKFQSFGDFSGHFQESFFKMRIEDSLLFCGTLLYSVGGVGAILDVRASMLHKSNFYNVLRDGILIVGVNYTFFGAFNYLVSLEETKEIYFYNLPLTRISLSLQIMYLFTIPMTYITNQFPILTIVEHWMDPREVYLHADSTEGGPFRKFLRYFVRYLIVVLTITIAYFMPSFDLFLSLVGSFNFAVMNGLIPVIAYNIRFKGRVSEWKMLLNIVILVIAVIVGFSGIAKSVNDMLKMQI
jgi:amino acid permease